MPEFVLVHTATPPSFNKVGHSGSRWTWTRSKREWQGIFETLLMAGRVPRMLTGVKVSAVLVFTTNRRRDEGNYRTILEKAIGDALVNGGWLRDDNPELFTFDRVLFEVGKTPETRVVLDVELSA